MKLSGIAQPLEKQFNDLLKMDPPAIMQTTAPEFLKIAALEQLNKASRPTPPPPQGTVAEQVVRQAVGAPTAPPMGAMPPGMPPGAPPMGAAPPMPPIEQGVANLPPPPPAAPPMEQGLASLPAGNMQFADGGIVSFAEGGYEDPVDAFERRKKFYEETGEYYPVHTRQGFGTRFAGDIHELSALSGLQPDKFYSDTTDVARALREPELRPTEIRAMLGVPVEQKPSTPEEDYGFSMEETPEPPEFGAGFDIQKAIAGGGPAPLPPMGEYPGSPQIEKPEKWDFDIHKKEQEEMDRAYGVDPDFWKKQGESLKEQLAGRQKEFTSDKWLALAEAGARMAQTPGTFGQALGAGMETGLGSLKTAARDFRQDKQKMQEIQNKLQMAQQAEARGRSEDAQRMKQSADDQYRNAVNEQTKIDAEYAMNKFAREEERAMTKYEVDNTWNMARYTAEMKFRIAAATNTAEGNRANLDLMKFIADRMEKANLGPEALADIQLSAMERADTLARQDEKYEDMKPADQEIYKARLAKEIAAGQIADIQRVTRGQTKDIFRATGLFAPERQ